MDGRKVILFIVLISIIALMLTWLFGQKVINDLDLNFIRWFI